MKRTSTRFIIAEIAPGFARNAKALLQTAPSVSETEFCLAAPVRLVPTKLPTKQTAQLAPFNALPAHSPAINAIPALATVSTHHSVIAHLENMTLEFKSAQIVILFAVPVILDQMAAILAGEIESIPQHAAAHQEPTKITQASLAHNAIGFAEPAMENQTYANLALETESFHQCASVLKEPMIQETTPKPAQPANLTVLPA